MGGIIPGQPTAIGSFHPRQAEVVPSCGAGAVADAHHGLVIGAARRFGEQVNITAPIARFEMKAVRRAAGQRFIAFRTVVARIAPGDRAGIDQVAPHADFDFSIDLQADITLALAGCDIVTRHWARAELVSARTGSVAHKADSIATTRRKWSTLTASA